MGFKKVLVLIITLAFVTSFLSLSTALAQDNGWGSEYVPEHGDTPPSPQPPSEPGVSVPYTKAGDVDADGLPDSWEEEHYNNIGYYGSDDDADGDGLPVFGEYLAGLSPVSFDDSYPAWLFPGIFAAEIDSDYDVLFDLDELLLFGTLSQNADSDFDGDGAPNSVELNSGSDPADGQDVPEGWGGAYIPEPGETVGDADFDNVPDTCEVTYFGSTTAYGNVDADGDGFTNSEECSAGTNPNSFMDYPTLAPSPPPVDTGIGVPGEVPAIGEPGVARPPTVARPKESVDPSWMIDFLFGIPTQNMILQNAILQAVIMKNSLQSTLYGWRTETGSWEGRLDAAAQDILTAWPADDLPPGASTVLTWRFGNVPIGPGGEEWGAGDCMYKFLLFYWVTCDAGWNDDFDTQGEQERRYPNGVQILHSNLPNTVLVGKSTDGSTNSICRTGTNCQDDCDDKRDSMFVEVTEKIHEVAHNCPRDNETGEIEVTLKQYQPTGEKCWCQLPQISGQ
jgi:hypothetical protein